MMVDAVTPWNGQQVIAQNAGYETQRLQNMEAQQQIRDNMALVQDVKAIDPSLSLMDQLNKAQSLALAHGRLGDAVKMSDMIAQTSSRIAQTDERVAKATEERAKADETVRKNVFATLGRPKSEQEWQQAKMAAMAMYPNMPKVLQDFMNQPFSPQLQKYLDGYGIDAEKQARLEKEQADKKRIEAAADAERALAADRRASAADKKETNPLKAKVEEARLAEIQARTALIEAQKAAAEVKKERDIKNGGKAVTKLTDANKEDKTDTASVLATRFPDLKGNDLDEAKRTLAQEAKARQAKEGGDIVTITKKIIAEQPGRIYKTADGKMKFKDIPTDVPAGYKFNGKVSSDGRRVWEKPGAKPMVETE